MIYERREGYEQLRKRAMPSSLQMEHLLTTFKNTHSGVPTNSCSFAKLIPIPKKDKELEKQLLHELSSIQSDFATLAYEYPEFKKQFLLLQKIKDYCREHQTVRVQSLCILKKGKNCKPFIEISIKCKKDKKENVMQDIDSLVV